MILDIESQLAERIQTRIQAPKQQEYHLMGQMRCRKGQTLFSLNLDTLEVKPVEIEAVVGELTTDGGTIAHRRATYDPRCLYWPAWNIKHAAKHFIKFLNKAFPDDTTTRN